MFVCFHVRALNPVIPKVIFHRLRLQPTSAVMDGQWPKITILCGYMNNVDIADLSDV